MIWDRHGSEQCRFQRPDSPRRSVCRSHTRLGSSHAMRCSQRQKPAQRHAERAQDHSTQAGSTAYLEHVQPTVAPRGCDPLRQAMPAHQYRFSRDFRARQEPSGTANRSIRGVGGSEVDFYTSATERNAYTISNTTTWTCQKRPRSCSDSKIDWSSLRVTVGKLCIRPTEIVSGWRGSW
jgi:hypothetical protein